MVRNVRVKIASATALLVSWDALYVSYLSHYTIYYRAKKFNMIFDEFTKEVLSTSTRDIVNIRELTEGMQHHFQVTASLKIDGETYEGEKSVPDMKMFGKALIHIHMSFLDTVMILV